MRLDSHLGGHFDSINRDRDARLTELHHILDEVDGAMLQLTPLDTEPIIARAIAENKFRIDDDLSQIAPAGNVDMVHLTDPYEIRLHPQDPTMVMASQLLHFTVSPRKWSPVGAFFTRRSNKQAVPRPLASYYLFGLSYDSAHYHMRTEVSDSDASAAEIKELSTKSQTPLGEMSVDKAVLSEQLNLDATRFCHEPPMDNYRVGLVRRGGDIGVFTITANANFGKVMPVLKGEGQGFSTFGEDAPSFGPVDRMSQKMRTIEATDRLTLDMIEEFKLALAGISAALPPPLPPKRRFPFRRRSEHSS